MSLRELARGTVSDARQGSQSVSQSVGVRSNLAHDRCVSHKLLMINTRVRGKALRFSILITYLPAQPTHRSTSMLWHHPLHWGGLDGENATLGKCCLRSARIPSQNPCLTQIFLLLSTETQLSVVRRNSIRNQQKNARNNDR